MTPEERAKVSPQQFDAWIREAIAAKPEARNPTMALPGGGRGCIYTDPGEPSCHCIIGEVLARRDPGALPAPDSADNIGAGAYGLLIEVGYDPEVGSLARDWQYAADDTWGERRPLPWREVPAAFSERRAGPPEADPPQKA